MTKEQLDRGGGLSAFLKDYKIQNYMQNKNEGNEKKNNTWRLKLYFE